MRQKLRLPGRVWIILLGLSANRIACGLWLREPRLLSYLHVGVVAWILAAPAAYLLTMRSMPGRDDRLIRATRSIARTPRRSTQPGARHTRMARQSLPAAGATRPRGVLLSTP